ncbi:hypothetical protein As57867_019271, partial [Aphanomyces stellatus]
MAGVSQPLLGARPAAAASRPFPTWAVVLAAGVGVSFVVVGQSFFANTFTWRSETFETNMMSPQPNTSNCSLHWFDQRLDHFTTLNTTYKQRYFVYDKFWARQANGHKKDGPIFFYCGNEGDVTLYVNNTGLMWENAEAFGALVIFAEHRYFGESMPFGDKYMDHLQYLTHEQALADYAFLLRSFQQDHNVQVPV